MMSTPTTTTGVDWNKELLIDSPDNNVTPYISNLVGRDLHLVKGARRYHVSLYTAWLPPEAWSPPPPHLPWRGVAGHPLNIIKTKIEDYFCNRDAAFERKDSLNPVVTPEQVRV